MIQRPRGTTDVATPDIELFQKVEALARELCERYSFSEIRTPTFEATELFERGSGEGTDVVQKEMYTFLDRGGRSLTLRPESTAPVVRSYFEVPFEGLQKFFYIQSHFRFERPQKGRLREHHQLGLEILGTDSPLADAEVIDYLFTYLGAAGLTGIQIALNSFGCPVCRPKIREAVVAYYAPHRPELCRACQERLEKNPLRLMDCKEEPCQPLKAGAPSATDSLCEDCQVHFGAVLECLRATGRPYVIDKTIVRGHDYYSRTIFEISHASLGAQSAICGGGRYDGLAETLGGPPTPGVGFGLGIERLVMTLQSLGQVGGRDLSRGLYLAVADASLGALALREAGLLRRGGLTVEVDLTGKSLKAQLRRAGKLGYGFTAILGTQEAEKGEITLRHMTQSTQETFSMTELAARITRGAEGAPK